MGGNPEQPGTTLRPGRAREWNAGGMVLGGGSQGQSSGAGGPHTQRVAAALGLTQNNPATTLLDKAERTSGPHAAPFLAEAVKAHYKAQGVYTNAEFPNQKAVALSSLKLVETQLQELNP